jgi:hypothetical protein
VEEYRSISREAQLTESQLSEAYRICACSLKKPVC